MDAVDLECAVHALVVMAASLLRKPCAGYNMAEIFACLQACKPVAQRRQQILEDNKLNLWDCQKPLNACFISSTYDLMQSNQLHLNLY